MEHRKIKAGSKYLEALSIKLLKKSFVLIRGGKGYIMCGYLNMPVANKLNDVAVKVTGVSNIGQTLKSVVHSCSNPAKKLGIRKGQPIAWVLKVIA